MRENREQINAAHDKEVATLAGKCDRMKGTSVQT